MSKTKSSEINDILNLDNNYKKTYVFIQSFIDYGGSLGIVGAKYKNLHKIELDSRLENSDGKDVVTYIIDKNNNNKYIKSLKTLGKDRFDENGLLNGRGFSHMFKTLLKPLEEYSSSTIPLIDRVSVQVVG